MADKMKQLHSLAVSLADSRLAEILADVRQFTHLLGAPANTNREVILELSVSRRVTVIQNHGLFTVKLFVNNESKHSKVLDTFNRYEAVTTAYNWMRSI